MAWHGISHALAAVFRVLCMRIRKATLKGKLAHSWDVFVKALLEERDELTDRPHSTRSPSKGEVSRVTHMPAQVDNWGVVKWHTTRATDSLLEIPTESVSVDNKGVYLELWGSDHNSPMVLAVGQLLLRPIVQAAFSDGNDGFGPPMKVEVPLFHNAHAIMYPIGSMCVVERGACVHVQLLTIAVCVMV